MGVSSFIRHTFTVTEQNTSILPCNLGYRYARFACHSSQALHNISTQLYKSNTYFNSMNTQVNHIGFQLWICQFSVRLRAPRMSWHLVHQLHKAMLIDATWGSSPISLNNLMQHSGYFRQSVPFYCKLFSERKSFRCQRSQHFEKRKPIFFSEDRIDFVAFSWK